MTKKELIKKYNELVRKYNELVDVANEYEPTINVWNKKYKPRQYEEEIEEK